MQLKGIETSQNQIAKFGLNRDWYHRSSGPCEWGTISLMREDLAAAGETIFIGHELGSSSFASSVASRATALSRLRNLHKAAGRLAKTAPDILAKPEVARANRTGFGGSDDFLPNRQRFQGYVQGPASSRENDAAPGSDAGGEF